MKPRGAERIDRRGPPPNQFSFAASPNSDIPAPMMIVSYMIAESGGLRAEGQKSEATLAYWLSALRSIHTFSRSMSLISGSR